MLALRFLGQIARQRGDDATAAARFRASLAHWREAQGWHVAGALEGLAGIAATDGQSETAVLLYAAAGALRDAVGAPLEPALAPDHDASLAGLRAVLGDEEFARCWEAGRTAGVAQAITAADAIRPNLLQEAPA